MAPRNRGSKNPLPNSTQYSLGVFSGTAAAVLIAFFIGPAPDLMFEAAFLPLLLQITPSFNTPEKKRVLRGAMLGLGLSGLVGMGVKLGWNKVLQNAFNPGFKPAATEITHHMPAPLQLASTKPRTRHRLRTLSW